MRFTGLENLPAAIRNAITSDEYDPGPLTDITVTKMIDSPRIAQLTKRHYKRIVKDARREMPSLIGKAVHALFEKHCGDAIAEERLSTSVFGQMLSGAMDVQKKMDSGAYLISDYKTWAVATKKYALEKATQQLNTYAYILRQNGRAVEDIEIIAIYKDWSEGKAQISDDYPKSPIEVIKLELWDDARCDTFVKSRVISHKIAGDLADNDLPDCTDDERWLRDSKWEVHQPKLKRPRLFNSEQEANDFLATKPGGGSVSFRLGVPIRCIKNYCGVAQFCNQFQKETKG